MFCNRSMFLWFIQMFNSTSRIAVVCFPFYLLCMFTWILTSPYFIQTASDIILNLRTKFRALESFCFNGWFQIMFTWSGFHCLIPGQHCQIEPFERVTFARLIGVQTTAQAREVFLEKFGLAVRTKKSWITITKRATGWQKTLASNIKGQTSGK